MRENALISIVVPIYNVEKYLQQCIKSLVSQTYRNLEIILVDDGSPDHCPEMCDEWEKKDMRIRAFHKKNGGLSDARNYGVKQARSEYVVFVDSDDYVTEDCISYLVHLKQKYHTDISIGGTVAVYDDVPPKRFRKKEREMYLSAEEAIREMFYNPAMGICAPNKLYPKALLDKWKFPYGKFYEDLATTYKILSSCNTVVYGTRQTYFYRQRTGSIIHSHLDDKHLSDTLSILEEMIAFTNCRRSNLEKAAEACYVRRMVELVPRVLSGSQKDKKMFRVLQKRVKAYYQNVIQDERVKKRTKIKSSFVILGYWPSFLLWKVCYFIQGK